MEPSFPIPTMTLDEFVSRLSSNSEVVAILAMGSTGQPDMKPYSDYDVAIVLADNAPLLFTASIWINRQLGDLYFFSTEEIETLLAQKTVQADSLLHKLLGWVASGKILHDPHQCLQQLREIPSASMKVQSSGDPRHQAWFGVNFNLAHNKRYFNSGDPHYWQALEIRLLYCLMDLLTAYFTLRNLPWQGEKAAIVHLKAHDPAFLAQFQHALRHGEMEEKFQDYTALAAQVLEPFGGVWADDECSVLMKENAPVDAGVAWLRQSLCTPYIT
jgi:hypothetical protein